jgi:hypothetical protein
MQPQLHDPHSRLYRGRGIKSRALNIYAYQNTVDRSYDAPRTPTSDSEDDEPVFSQAAAATQSEGREHVAAQAEPVQKRKPGGYTSRIEQILYENPNMPILITDAGKSLESGGRYIVYTIRTGVRMAINML